MARIILQTALAGPVFAFAPWAFFVGIGTIVQAFAGEIGSLSKFVSYGFGWLGLIGLFGSIFLSADFLRFFSILRVLVIGFIICGFISTLGFIWENGDPIGNVTRMNWQAAWLLGGPVVVGVWNLVRILRKEPNKAPEPTVRAGTPPAAQESRQP